MSIWSISISGFDYRLKIVKNKVLSSETRQSILVLRNEDYSVRAIDKKLKRMLCTTPFIEQYKLALTRIERGVGGPGAQLRKRTSTVSSLRNRHLTSPQMAASLNSTRKTPVSTSTVKRQLRDAGLLGRGAKKKPYLRLANKKKRLKWSKTGRTRNRSTEKNSGRLDETR